MTTIYTLELEHNKYYIGRSNTPDKRILNHFYNNGSEWTKLHKPIRVVSKIIGDNFDEEKYTLMAIDKYGIDNVRGGSYCKLLLSDQEKKKALQTILSITDKCYKCGNKGHFANNCNTLKYCKKCGLTVTKHDNINHIGTCCKNCRWALNESDNNSYIGEKCKNCDGTGLLLNSEYCSNCRGSGFVNYNIHYGYCLECNCIKCNNKHNNCRCLNTENYDILISFLLKNPIEMDKYIRTILGQMIFVSGENHLRFNYDCTCSSDIEYNRYIIDMFTMFYNNQRIAMYTSEGSIEVCVIPLNKYSKHDYWNDIDLCNGMKIYNYSGDGTVMIITKILHLLNNSNIPDDFVKIPDKLYIENTMSV